MGVQDRWKPIWKILVGSKAIPPYSLYQNIVNTILGNPTEEIDEDLLLNIENDLARYFGDQPIENGGQTAPASVSWSEFVATPVGPTLNDTPTAVDYPNLVSLFNQGEAASNVDYDEYQAYHDKMDSVEEQTVIVSVPQENNLFANIATMISNGWTTVTSFVTNLAKFNTSENVINPSTPIVPDYLKNTNDPVNPNSVFTPDSELQELIDTNISKQLEEGTVSEWFGKISDYFSKDNNQITPGNTIVVPDYLKNANEPVNNNSVFTR